jgi:ankyrin repeat protein
VSWWLAADVVVPFHSCPPLSPRASCLVPCGWVPCGWLFAGRTIEAYLDDPRATVNPEQFDASSGLNCLMMAVAGGHVRAASLLLTKGRANINATAPAAGGATALHFAALNDQLECVKFLIEQKANPNLEDDVRTAPHVHTSTRPHVHTP